MLIGLENRDDLWVVRVRLLQPPRLRSTAEVRRPVTAEGTGSNPVGVALVLTREYAPVAQRTEHFATDEGDRGFDSCQACVALAQ